MGRIIKKSTIKNAPYIARDEVDMIRDLRHENIVSLLENFQSVDRYVYLCGKGIDDRYFIVIDLASGGDLASRCKMGVMQEIDAIRVIK
jgi:hypothetical protein